MGTPQIGFVVDGGDPYTLAAMLDANGDDPALCEWLKTATPGQNFEDCVCVEVAA